MSAVSSAGSDFSGPTAIYPQSPEDVRDIIAAALSDESPLVVEGNGSKAGLGRPVQAARTLSLAKMSGVTLYEPEELVLSAKAGTPIAEIEALLDANHQRLEFEPLDYGPLHGRRGRGGDPRWCRPPATCPVPDV